MSYHETTPSDALQAVPFVGAVGIGNPKVPVAILEQILDDIRRTLASDPSAAQASVARLSEILSGKEIALAAPVYARGGFAPWQKRRIASYLIDHLEEAIRIKALAQMITLSTSQFCRAFKQSFGKTPHAHLMELRVARAKQLMLTTREPLSQIALACGLADQAHLSKIFRRYVGQSPSVWRRLHDERD
jgi:AraC family transcriptional regulator